MNLARCNIRFKKLVKCLKFSVKNRELNPLGTWKENELSET